MSTVTTPSHLEERIDLLVKELAAKRRSTNWSSNLSLFIGLIAILALCGYFGFGYYMLNDITRPEIIIGSAKTYVEKYSVEARKTAAEEVRKSAPIWASQASNELISNMPSLREKAEVTIASYFDDQLQQSQDATRQEFEKIVKENHGDFEEAINIIVEEDKSDEFVNKILPLIENQYGTDMRSNASSVLGALQDISRRLEKLARGKDLNPIEDQQRHILGLTRMLRE